MSGEGGRSPDAVKSQRSPRVFASAMSPISVRPSAVQPVMLTTAGSRARRVSPPASVRTKGFGGVSRAELNAIRSPWGDQRGLTEYESAVKRVDAPRATSTSQIDVSFSVFRPSASVWPSSDRSNVSYGPGGPNGACREPSRPNQVGWTVGPSPSGRNTSTPLFETPNAG